MKKYSYLFLALLIFILLPTSIKAYCEESEKNYFSQMADEYTATYEYDYDKETYTVTLNIPEPKSFGYRIKYYVDYTELVIESNEKIREINRYPLKPNRYTVEIMGTTDSCNDVLKTIKLNLVRKNPYAGDPLCTGIEEFVLCQENYDKDIDYDTFVSRVNVYKNSKNKETPTTTKATKTEVVEYIENNLFQIIIVVAFVVLAVVTAIIMITSFKKSRRLE